MMINKLRPATRRLGLLAALVVAFGAVFVTPALAHTRLVGSTPGKDATAASVTEVKLVFSDKISVAKVLVKDGTGKAFQTGAATRSGTTVTQKLSAALPAGAYTVSYAVVGEDGHRIEKSDLKFTAAAGDGAQPAGDGIGTEQSTGPATPITEGWENTPKPKAAKKESGSGTVMWVLIGVGVLVGVGIGVLIVVRAKRKHPAQGGSQTGE